MNVLSILFGSNVLCNNLFQTDILFKQLKYAVLIYLHIHIAVALLVTLIESVNLFNSKFELVAFLAELVKSLIRFLKLDVEFLSFFTRKNVLRSSWREISNPFVFVELLIFGLSVRQNGVVNELVVVVV